MQKPMTSLVTKVLPLLLVTSWVASIYAVISALLYTSWLLLFVALGWFFLSSHLLFKDTMNLVQGVGPVYWLVKNSGKPGDPMFSLGFMRETDAPWRVGRGVQFRFHIYLFQLGLCRHTNKKSENDGILAALKGHYMDSTVKEIKTWD